MSRNLTLEEQRLIDMYIQLYNLTNNQIEQQLNILDDIRANMMDILVSSSSSHRRRNRNRNRNNNAVYYDYNSPINPNLYTGVSSQNSLRNFINTPPSNNHSQNSLRNFINTPQSNNHSQNSLFNYIDNRSASRSTNNIPANATINTSTQQNFINEFIRGFSRGFNSTYSDLLNSNVIVRPTEQQIQNASRIVRYDSIEHPLSESCPITLERFNPDDNVRQIHHCGHIFLPQAFNEWFNTNVRCPVCRFDIREHTNNNSVTATAQPSTAQPSVSDEFDDSSDQESVAQDNSADDNIVNSTEFTDNLLSSISSRLIQSLINSNSINENSDDRIMFDASNNILVYETILRPGFTTSTNPTTTVQQNQNNNNLSNRNTR